VAILWRGHEVARLGPGKNLLSPRVLLDRRSSEFRRGPEAVIERLKNWVRLRWSARSEPSRAGAPAQDPGGPAVRSVLAMLVDEGGIIARSEVAQALRPRPRQAAMSQAASEDRRARLFMPDVLKPEARRWRTALRAAASGADARAPAHSERVLRHAFGGERALSRRLAFASARRCCGRPGRAARPPCHEARTGKQAA
jgi:ATP-dependent RNA helicase SUPV3L1/SUV3